jgi:hypothetical protein
VNYTSKLENANRLLGILFPSRWARRNRNNNKDLSVSERDKKRTWVDELADESNIWLSATRYEREEDFISAIIFYIRDAKQCLKEGWMTRAALSCFCTANCMMKSGHPDEAHKLYSEAGAIYVEQASKIIGSSIREALWSLQQAYESYYAARDQNNAQRVYEQYVSIASKVNPFYNLKERVDVVDFTKRSRLHIDISNDDIKQPSRPHVRLQTSLTQEAEVAIEDFFKQRWAHKSPKSLRYDNDGLQKKTGV